MGGGILPVSIHKGKLYFLFSREYINSKKDGGLWSDFGGSKEKNETFLEILQNEEGLVSKVDQKVLFITTDSWLAQLGSRKNS